MKSKFLAIKTTYIIDAIRTPLGNFGGALATIRVDDLGALVIKTLMDRNPNVPKEAIEDVITDCKDNSMDFTFDLEDDYESYERETDFTQLEIM